MIPDRLVSDTRESLNDQIELIQEWLDIDTVPDHLTDSQLQNRLDDLNETIEILDAMENDPKNEYRVEVADGDSPGETYMDSESGEIVIRVNDASDTGLLIHELEHVNQYMNGDLGFDENGNPTGLTIEDEVEAFQVQHNALHGVRSRDVDWEGNVSSDWKVTPEWIIENYPEYNDLPSENDEPAGSTDGGASSN